ncbi:MAG: T9SS type B sorting domain-containing protein [Maribacter sp.]|nr:T9SS type B sorting domain-containing protein [Maribacter sp.]
MKRIVIFLYIALLLGMTSAFAQVSPDCVNAIPICNNTPVNGGTLGYGSDDFNGASTTGCLEQTLTGAIESNSAWYRFRTGASGQLGFNIGFDTSEDWDFALYKTNDCNNLGEPIRCNFFDNQDESAFIGIGEDPSGFTQNIQYEDWIQVEPGEDYYLLINNFSNSNSGFSIQFSGHIFVTNPYDALDCSIINNLLGPPISACEGDSITLDATTATAIDYNWLEDQGSGFIAISGEHNPTLQVNSTGVYRVNVIMPSGNNIISDVQVAFSTMPITNAISADVSCSGSAMYDLAQKDAEALGGQNPSEFIVSYHTSSSDATNGINSLPKQYLMVSASETIYVRVTSITNPICFDDSQNFQLTNLETPTMQFDTEVFICADNSDVTIGEISPPDPNYTYLWDTGETTSSIVVSQAGSYTVTATITQAGTSCSDFRTINVTTSTTPVITDVLIEDLQNNNTVTILTNITDNIEYQLDDGVFQDSNVFTDVFPGMHTVTVNDTNGCGVVTEQLVVVGFPKFFTPNGDGNNDLWQIAGISNLEEPVIHIHDRYGKLLKQLNGNDAGWDGNFNGNPLPSSDYWFKLTYKDSNGLRNTAKYVNSHFSLRR